MTTTMREAEAAEVGRAIERLRRAMSGPAMPGCSISSDRHSTTTHGRPATPSFRRSRGPSCGGSRPNNRDYQPLRQDAIMDVLDLLDSASDAKEAPGPNSKTIAVIRANHFQPLPRADRDPIEGFISLSFLDAHVAIVVSELNDPV